jgi:hypothetical protein
MLYHPALQASIDSTVGRLSGIKPAQQADGDASREQLVAPEAAHGIRKE